VTVAAGVAAVAIVALQQRAISPRSGASPVTAQSVTGQNVTAQSVTAQNVTAQNVTAQNVTAQNVTAPLETAAANQMPVQGGGGPREALSYTVPAVSTDAPSAISPARLTNYVFAHSKYSSVLGQRGVLADLLIEDDEPQLIPIQRAAPPPPAPEKRVAP
jgi:hypothetical protein